MRGLQGFDFNISSTVRPFTVRRGLQELGCINCVQRKTSANMKTSAKQLLIHVLV